MDARDLLGSMGEGEAGKQAWIGSREQQWEATVVRRIVRTLKCCSMYHVIRAADELTGEKELICTALARAIPALPVRFATARISGHRYCKLGILNLRSLQKSLLYATYQKELTLDPDVNLPLALVFPWVRHCPMVLHRDRPSLEEPGSIFLMQAKSAMYVIERLSRLLKRIRHGLKPAEERAAGGQHGGFGRR
jgi:hypothetical protein